MDVIDLHSDIITDIAFRRENGETKVFEQYHLPQLKASGVRGLICVLWVEPLFRHDPLGRFRQLLRHALDDFQECGEAEIVTSAADLDAARQRDNIFIYLGLEGLSFMKDWDGSTDNEKITRAVDYLDERHIRHAIFAWNEANFLASGTGCESTNRGLTQSGALAAKQMEDKGWIIDVSHLDEPSFWGVVEHTNGPLIASHSNAKQLCSHERNLTDAQLKAVAERNGLIGVNAHAKFVAHERPSLSTFVDQVVYITELVGVDHVALGFDFTDYLENYDLGDDDASPVTKNLESAARIPDVLDEMVKRGFSTTELEQICSGNALNFLRDRLHLQEN